MFYSNRSDQLCLFLICSLVSFPDQCSLRAVNISLIVSYEYRVKEQFFGPFAIVPLWLNTRLHVHRVFVLDNMVIRSIDASKSIHVCTGPTFSFLTK